MVVLTNGIIHVVWWKKVFQSLHYINLLSAFRQFFIMLNIKKYTFLLDHCSLFFNDIKVQTTVTRTMSWVRLWLKIYLWVWFELQMNFPDLPKFGFELKMNIPDLPIAVFKTFIMQSVHSPPGVYWQPNKSTDKDTSAGSNHGFFSDIIIMRVLNHIWSKSFDLSFVTICQNPSHMFLRNLALNENSL